MDGFEMRARAEKLAFQHQLEVTAQIAQPGFQRQRSFVTASFEATQGFDGPKKEGGMIGLLPPHIPEDRQHEIFGCLCQARSFA